VDAQTLEILHKVFQSVDQQKDWKLALDALLASMRPQFVYDNVAVYLLDPGTRGLEVVYARAVGRGKTGEADVAWGQSIATQVLDKQGYVVMEPKRQPGSADRLAQEHFLGLPIYVGTRLSGALVFVRFGGPEFQVEHIWLGSLMASWTAFLIERGYLQTARSELESVQRQMRLQEDFVSTISHELRTPLGFIKGYSTSLLREDTAWDEKTQREFLSIIDEEADRLRDLIENMLESARLQSNTLQFKFQPLRLDALIRDVTLRVKTHHPDLQVTLDFADVPPIPGDGVRLSQVLDNLFSNAEKYAPAAPIVITLRPEQQFIRLDFRDHGPGIAADFLPFIFERFYRVPAERTITGTGLGLYICKQIILAHHGKIWAESVLNQGTTFFIQLPVSHED
jgi:signal transduction histidine kinase